MVGRGGGRRGSEVWEREGRPRSRLGPVDWRAPVRGYRAGPRTNDCMLSDFTEPTNSTGIGICEGRGCVPRCVPRCVPQGVPHTNPTPFMGMRYYSNIWQILSL